MTLVLYHSVESTCAQKVRLVLARKSLAWREVRLNLRRGDQFDAGYLKLNPKAVVPTLVDGDTVVCESSVINEYLEDRCPDPALRPEDPAAAAAMRLLIKRIDDDVHGAIGILSYAIFLRHQMNERLSRDELEAHFARVADPARRARQRDTHEQGLAAPGALTAIVTLRRFAAALSEALGSGDWLVADRYSLADAAAIPYLYRARALQLDALWAEFPAVTRWLERGIANAEGLALEEPFGSASFRDMVERHADAARDELGKLLS